MSSIQAAIVIPVQQQQKFFVTYIAVRTKCTETENPRQRQDFVSEGLVASLVVIVRNPFQHCSTATCGNIVHYRPFGL
jgi:hypothetical protein